MPRKNGTDYLALNSDAAPVDDSHSLQIEPAGLIEILLDNHLDISRVNGMQIENVCDRDANRFIA
jgi:hypothetical protein